MTIDVPSWIVGAVVGVLFLTTVIFADMAVRYHEKATWWKTKAEYWLNNWLNKEHHAGHCGQS